MIVLSADVIEIIGESLCEDFIKQLETCQKEDDHYLMDGAQVFFEERGKNTYIQSIGEKKKEIEPKRKFVVLSEHFYESLRMRFGWFVGRDDESIKRIILACFHQNSVKIGGQYENNFIYKSFFNDYERNKKVPIYFPVAETADRIVLKTALTEEMALNNLSEIGGNMDTYRSGEIDIPPREIKPIVKVPIVPSIVPIKVLKELPKEPSKSEPVVQNEVKETPPKYIEEYSKNHNINVSYQHMAFIRGSLLFKDKTFAEYVASLIQKDFDENNKEIYEFYRECNLSLKEIRKKHKKGQIKETT